MKEQVIKHLESVADEFEVDMSDAIDLINELDEELTSVKGDKAELQDEASDLRDDVKKLKSRIEDLEEETECLEEQLEEKSDCFEYPQGFDNNIVVVGVLESLFENMDRIPISDLEDFVNKYSI